MNADVKKSFVVKIQKPNAGFHSGLFIDSGYIPFQSPSGNIQAFRNHLNTVLCTDKAGKHLGFSVREGECLRESAQLLFFVHYFGCGCDELLHKSFLLKSIYDRHNADRYKQNQHKDNDGKIAV